MVVGFRLLGPVEVRVAGQWADAGQPRQRTVLAALLVDAGRLITVETLVDRVWGEDPPDRVRHSLYAHLSRIRGVLSGTGARLANKSGLYVLDVDPQLVDLHRFRRLTGQARARDGRDRADLLHEALAMWRGEPLAGLTGLWADRLRALLRRERLTAVLAFAAARLEIGDPESVLTPLTDLNEEFPLEEPVAAALMRALSAAGHTARALEVYTRTRRCLVEELASEPGSELRELHSALLRVDAVLGPADTSRATAIIPGLVPREMPAAAAGFRGRDAELAQLRTHLDDQGATAVISVVSGMAGVGKTALVLHWAHQVAGRFGDGQLYVDLRGFSATGMPMTPAEAIRAFLDSLARPAQRIPAGLAAQTRLYRSLTAGRRMLMVLDNAASVAQVRPLLPGTSGCLVLVTSRDQLPGLVARDGACRIELDPLPRPVAVALLRMLIGIRADRNPAALATLAERCAGLPLALRIAAELVVCRPDVDLADLVAESGAHMLDWLDVPGDEDSAVRAAFGVSYRRLGDPAARMFRLLGLHPGPDIGPADAASLAALPVRSVRPLLTELGRAHMLTEYLPGRYRLPALLRAYAAEKSHALDSESERSAALLRVLGQDQRDSGPVAPASIGPVPAGLRRHTTRPRT